MSKRIVAAVLAAVFAAATFGVGAFGVAAASTAVMAVGDPTDPPTPCPIPDMECDDDDYGWTNPGT